LPDFIHNPQGLQKELSKGESLFKRVQL
jgi:hypothetical protein